MLVSEDVMGKCTSMYTSVIQYIPLLDVCINPLLGRYLLCIIVTCFFIKEPKGLTRGEAMTFNCISTTPVNASIIFLSLECTHLVQDFPLLLALIPLCDGYEPLGKDIRTFFLAQYRRGKWMWPTRLLAAFRYTVAEGHSGLIKRPLKTSSEKDTS